MQEPWKNSPGIDARATATTLQKFDERTLDVLSGNMMQGLGKLPETLRQLGAPALENSPGT